jgi:hypothetical protein
MTLEFLNPNTYTFAGGLPVKSGRDLIIPDSIVLSQTMLVKWQIRQLVKGATIEQIPPAILSTSLEISGLGTLSHDEQQIQPSQQGKDVVQFWHIDPSLPYKLKFSGVSDLVANSVLEFYTSSIEEYYMGVSNPITQTASTDPAALQQAITNVIPAMAQAIGAQSGVAVQTALANQASANQAKSSRTAPVTVKAWTGNIDNHLILAANPVRIGANLAHPGTKVSITNTSDVFVGAGKDGRTGVTSYDYQMAQNGTYITDQGRDTLPLYAWLLTGRPDTQITVTEDLPAAPVAPVAPSIPS